MPAWAALTPRREWFALAATSLYAHQTPHFALESYKKVASFVTALERSPRNEMYRSLPRRLRFGLGGDDVGEAALMSFAASVNRILHLCERLVRVEVVGATDSGGRSWLYRPIGQAFVTKQRNFDITDVSMSTLSIGAISYEAVAAIATHYPGLKALEFNNVEFHSTFPFKALSRSMPNLRSLTLTHHNLTTTKLELLLTGCDNLNSLHIMGNEQLDDDAARVIAGLSGLRKLVVQCNAGWPSENGLHIMFANLHTLEHVEISASTPYSEDEAPTDGVIQTIAAECGNLRFLRLQNLSCLTDSTVMALRCGNLRHLQDIFIIDCWGIDAEAIRRLARAQKFPNRVVIVERGWYTRMGQRVREKLAHPPAYLLAMAVVSNLFLVRWIFAAL